MRTITTVCGLVLVLASLAYGADIYITQNTSGAGTGVDCANARSAAWFNANATGGNTYHLCGTFTGAANSTMLTIPVSGSLGNILYVLFETNAVLTSPQWSANGAIYGSNKNYITIDGGTNGIIRNTDNGTLKTYHQYSTGVVLSGDNLVVKNLTINNIYQNDGSTCYPAGTGDLAGALTWGISVASSTTGNITVDNNKVTGARAGIIVGFSNGGTNIEVKNNTLRKQCWGMYISANENSSGNVTISNFNVHNNDIGDFNDWQYPGGACSPDYYHQDGIIVSGHGTITNTAINLYNNYIHGLKGGSVTGSLFCTWDGVLAPGPACNAWNNIFAPDATDGGVGNIVIGNSKTNYFYNNTIIAGGAGSSCFIFGNAGTHHLINNICTNAKLGIESWGGTWRLGTVDYNLWYDSCKLGHCWSDNVAYHDNITTWRAAGRDVHGYMTNPLFLSSTDFQLQATSPAIDKGTSSISPLTFTTDNAGVARPQGSAWDIGAYEFIGVKPLPPKNLKITP